ncbi:MAG: dTDP-glucose 4,6-dehydratase [Actinomycetota bacterium]
MKILVPGAAGFIGSHFVDLLVRARPSDELAVLDALTYAGDIRNLAAHEREPRFQFVRGDVADPKIINPLVEWADLVVNFAAESFVDRSIEEAAPFVRTNLTGTLVLLDACRTSRTAMVQVSTDEVYGSIAQGAFSESSLLAPNNPYSATKAGGDLLCRAYHHTYGMDVRIMRGPNSYGPRQNPEKAIPTFTIAALTRKQLPIYGDGSNRREWLYVADFCRAVLTVAEDGEPGEIYNAGGGHELANLELATEICRLTGAPEALITFVEDRPGHDFRYSMVWDRLSALGWKPETDFGEGLERTVTWFQQHAERWPGGLGG